MKWSRYDASEALKQAKHLARFPYGSPAEVPPQIGIGYVIEDLSGGVSVLCSVNNLNKLPKSLATRGQAILPSWEHRGEQVVLFRREGDIWLVGDRKPRDIDTFVHRA
jgi:hypothetical protein